jgi:putative phosphotransacetylase
MKKEAIKTKKRTIEKRRKEMLKRIPIRVSGRHVHISKEDGRILFGDNYQLTKFKSIDQPGQFSCREKVTVKSNDDKISGIRLVGPERAVTQVELSGTDSYKLKIDPPIKQSVLADGPEATEVELIGPAGRVKRPAAILAHRHLHFSPAEAEDFGLKDGQKVKIAITGQRGLIFENVLVRVDPAYRLAMHIDSDEGNASGITREGIGELLM